MLGVGEILGAEPAADIGRDEPHIGGRHAERARRRVAVAVDVLAGDMQRVAALRRIIRADRAARLHRIGDDAMVVEVQRNDMRGRCERRIDRIRIAPAPVHADIARHLGGNLRRTGGTRGGSGGDRRQWPVVDHHALGGIERLRARLGDDQRDRLADMAHLVARQQRLRREGEWLAGLHVGFHRRTHRLQPVGSRILAGQHGQHAGHRARRRGVDPLDPRMRVRRAQHHGMRQRHRSADRRDSRPGRW